MTTLTTEQIYNDLNYNWWVDDDLPDGQICPSTMLYFTDKAGNTDSLMSVGAIDYANTNRQDYVQNYLMWEAARALANGKCAGNITNIKPNNFQVFPIYFK